jgi:tetratricopeptide (TPR) repeat protein
MFSRSAFRLLILGAVLLCHAAAQDQTLLRAAQLDSEQKCDEAEQLYNAVLAKGPPSPALLNNLGNHYLSCGAPDKAQSYFEQLLKINPTHVNANLQLARLATSRKDGVKALAYLSRFRDADPVILLLRAEALQQVGKKDSAVALIDELAKKAAGDPRILFSLGVTCGRMGLYEKAEAAFNGVLTQIPDDYDVLYNLGIAAARAGHYDRARQALEVALKVKPDDVDALLELGRVESNLGDYNRAVFLLAGARNLAPQRPEVLLALARAAQGAGYYGDSDVMYSEYLKLRPEDDMVRRDRALVHGYSDTGRKEALQELTRYTQKYPQDAVGFFDLAQISYYSDRAQALAQVSNAVRLDPSLEPAHYIRAWLLHRLGRDRDALTDLQIAIRLNPRDALAFDQLGLTYMDLDKPADAEQALRRAEAISPDEPKILMHLARVLTDCGHPDQAQPFIERFRQLQSDGPTRPREDQGIIASASVSPAERSRRTLEQLQQRVRANPGDASLKLNLGSLWLLEGKTAEATAVFRELLTMDPGGIILYKAGILLLSNEQYALARDFLQRAAAVVPSAQIDLAMALFFLEGPQPALKALEQAPESVERGDWLLTKARILDAAGQVAESDRTVGQALKLAISRPRLAEELALLSVRHHNGARALELIDQALRSAPDNPDLMLARAVVSASLSRNTEAVKAVKEVESRWPEWDQPYLVEGLLMEREKRFEEARSRIHIAVALGTHELAAQCAQARLSQSGSTAPECACQPGIYELFFSACETPQAK